MLIIHNKSFSTIYMIVTALQHIVTRRQVKSLTPSSSFLWKTPSSSIVFSQRHIQTSSFCNTLVFNRERNDHQKLIFSKDHYQNKGLSTLSSSSSSSIFFLPKYQQQLLLRRNLAIPTSKGSKTTKNNEISPTKVYILRSFGKSDHLSAQSSCGIVLYDSETSNIVWKGRLYSQYGESADEIEYTGINYSMKVLKNLGVKRLIIQGNEKSNVINQLQEKYKIVNNRMKVMHENIKMFLKEHMDHFEISEIPSEEFSFDKKAKSLAKDSMRKRTSNGFQDATVKKLSPDKVYVLRFDGGSRGNPGIAGAGMAIFDSESQLEIVGVFKYLDIASNNVAEYTALADGLELAREMGVKHIIVEGDSQLVINQVNGVYKVKADHLKPLHQKALSKSKEFVSFNLNYIPRSENFRADQLANMAMDEKTSSRVFNENLEYSVTKDQEILNDKNNNEENLATKALNDSVTGDDNIVNNNTNSAPSDNKKNPIQLSKTTKYVLKFCISSKSEKTYGAAMNLYDENTRNLVWSGTYFISMDVSSNVATYMALIAGLTRTLSFGVEKLLVECTSNLIINQLSGKFRVKSEAIAPYHEIATNLIKQLTDFEILHLDDKKTETQLKAASKEVLKTKKSQL